MPFLGRCYQSREVPLQGRHFVKISVPEIQLNLVKRGLLVQRATLKYLKVEHFSSTPITSSTISLSMLAVNIELVSTCYAVECERQSSDWVRIIGIDPSLLFRRQVRQDDVEGVRYAHRQGERLSEQLTLDVETPSYLLS